MTHANDSEPAAARRKRLIWLGVAAISIVTYIFVIAGNIDKPFGTDEIYYAGWAHGIAKTGTPAYYSGEGAQFFPRIIEPISHPTLHFKALAVMVLVFGLKYWSLRLLGVILFLATLLFVRFKILKDEDDADERLVLTGFFLVFSPMFLQESLVLAIEAQAFWFPMLVFLYLFHLETVGENRFRFYPYLYTTPALITLFWLKETNVPIYLAVCLIYLALTRNFRKAPGFFLAFGVSVALFWTSWVVYCRIADVDVWCWYDFTFRKKLLKGSSGIHKLIAGKGLGAAIDKVLLGLKVSISWLSGSYAALFFLAAYVRIRDLIKGRSRLGFMELCLIYIVVLFGITKIVRPTPSFVKYEVPAHFLMAVFMADVYFGIVRKELFAFGTLLVLGGIAGAAAYGVVPDRLLEMKTFFGTHLLQSLGSALLVGIVLYAVKKKQPYVAAVLGMSASVVALNTNLYIHQSTEDYTTGHSWGNYGEDLVAPTKWLRKHMKNGDTIAVFKDLQFNMRFVEGKTKSPTYEVRMFSKWKRKKREKAKLLNSGEIRYIVLSRYADSSYGRRFITENNYRKVARAGKHVIYERKKCPVCRKKKKRRKKKRG